MDWQAIFSVAVVLFFIMDPLGNMPIFNAVLGHVDTTRKVQIAPAGSPFARYTDIVSNTGSSGQSNILVEFTSGGST